MGSDPGVCLFPGVPASQLHRYGGLGRIDVSAVLQPLDFILPQKEPEPEPLLPEADIPAEQGSLTQPKPEPSQPGRTETAAELEADAE